MLTKIFLIIIIIILIILFYNTAFEKDSKYKDSNITESIPNSFDELIQEIRKRFPIDDISIEKDLREMQLIQKKYSSQKVPYLSNITCKELFWLQDTGHQFNLYDWIDKKFNKNDYYEILLMIDRLYVDSIMKAKTMIRKPRPHVWSKKLNIPIDYALVASADSFSMPSGHAIQGFLFGCLFYKKNRDFFDSNPHEMDQLALYCSDHGLCRVIGGVHFMDDYRAGLLFTKFVMRNENVQPMLDRYDKRLKTLID